MGAPRWDIRRCRFPWRGRHPESHLESPHPPLAAFEMRTEVTLDDIKRTITLCLRHRCRRDPMESINSGDKIDAIFQKIFVSAAI